MKTVVLRAQQRWECRFVTAFSDQSLLNIVNDSGKEGWEPFSILQYRDMKGTLAWAAFLKRPAGATEPVKASETAAASPAEQAPDKPSQPSGWDLSGDTFEIKKEPPPPEPKKEAPPAEPKKDAPAAPTKK